MTSEEKARKLEDKSLLIENLLARMDYNEKNRTWLLPGKISEGERSAIRDANLILRVEAYKIRDRSE